MPQPPSCNFIRYRMTRQQPDAPSTNPGVPSVSSAWSGVSLRVATIRPECELGLGCKYSTPSPRLSALHTFHKPLGILKSPHATTACRTPSRSSDLNGQGRPPLQGGE